MLLIRRFLLRAPLLPGDSAASLLDSSLGRLALQLASSSLAAAAPGDARAARARDRYTARARFRPTPHGLLAGIAAGKLGARTAIDTGAPAARMTLSYRRLAAVARALLDDPETRHRTRLRVAPSILRHGDHVMWLSPRAEALEAELDDLLEAVLAAAARAFTPWRTVARAALRGGDDDVLLGLIDDGLLCSDLTPPLVGPPPLDALRARLGRLRTPAARAAAAALAADARDLAAGRLPADPEHVVATLVFPRARVTLADEAVARAARLAPLLARLAEALAPPAAERDLAAPEAAVDAAAELVGAGALDLAALALGGYGVRADEPAPPRPPPAPPAALLTLLIDRISAAAAAGAAEIVLDPDELDRLLPPAPPPPTLELFLVPRAEAAGEPPGSGWLLGLHAPAGATWGRFAHAGGRPVTAALAELARAEPRGCLDVAFAPDEDLADLCAHPPVRAATLALSGWPEGAAVTPTALALSVAGAPAPLALAGGTPSPLWRVRSTLAPPGVYRLLAGWSLRRQHAPWALAWGALAQQAWLPRVRLGGFVIAPQSWRLPATVPLPARVQVGHEDELLLVDSPAELARLAAGPEPPRAWEVWPPLDEPPVDAAGRRVEAVVAVVTGPDDPDEHDEAAAVLRPAPPPVAEPGWRTFKLYGPPDRQERVLLDAVAPTVAAARAAGEIDGWFFLRYLEGARHHLRVRVHGDGRAFATRLDAALPPACAAGDVVTVEETPYHRERARYPTPVEPAFQAGSDLAAALLADADEDADAEELAVRALDAHARAAGLSLAARLDLASALRAGHEPYPDEAAAIFRARAARLHRALTDEALALDAIPRAALPDLLHLCANRLLGVDPAREALAVYLWQRALEGLEARRRRPKGNSGGRRTRGR